MSWFLTESPRSPPAPSPPPVSSPPEAAAKDKALPGGARGQDRGTVWVLSTGCWFWLGLGVTGELSCVPPRCLSHPVPWHSSPNSNRSHTGPCSGPQEKGWHRHRAPQAGDTAGDKAPLCGAAPTCSAHPCGCLQPSPSGTKSSRGEGGIRGRWQSCPLPPAGSGTRLGTRGSAAWGCFEKCSCALRAQGFGIG